MYDINSINLGEALRKYRKLKHFSLEYIGSKIYKTKATISKYENGEITPDFFTVLELCNFLDVDIASFAPYVSTIYKNPLPLNSNVLYLYYLAGNKIVSSTIHIKPGSYKNFIAYFYNGIKKNIDNYTYYYEGSAEFSEKICYMNFKNLSSDMMKIEQVQIIIHLPLSDSMESPNCFITGLTPNFVPIIKKALITTSPLDSSEINLKKLKISKEELQKISSENAWALDF